MINLLHSYHPQAILLSFGPVNIYWYGLFVVLGIMAALALTFQIAKYYNIAADNIFDLSFWLIIGGIIGARIYDDLLQLPYYMQHPWQSLEIWKGGLAIHGAIIAGLVTVWFFARKKQLTFWKLSAAVVPGLALGQAIGRWGNYFNQEIFGLPTDLSWGIPIDLLNRPNQYIADTYFQPTFLYESLGCLLISLILCIFTVYTIKKNKLGERFYVWMVALYMVLYSILRFNLEFIRLDEAPHWLGLRFPQIISLLIIIFSVLLLLFNHHDNKEKDS